MKDNGKWVQVFSDDDQGRLRYWRDVLKQEGVRAKLTDNTPYEGHKALEIHSSTLRKALKVAIADSGRARGMLPQAIRYAAKTQHVSLRK